ncbi:hypothetical protein H632_c2235p0 [Helicosporidium sp. ATCC 50920]|nr:hypothetical protein H632_c2235p0 [Helicosporidium sp. ATCC 50920]|eukprot:KDD73383.1 hypothetical protein H632_c2235p0 [Helicosporidium sp. ATCC 50920]
MATAGLTDLLFGTRNYTQGAEYQLPRKTPLRIEPKTYFANERTFLAWLSMATTLGTVVTAITGFAADDDAPARGGAISQYTVRMITLTLLPVSILLIAYALFTFYFRSESIRRKTVGFFDDKLGPITIAIVILLSLMAIFIAAVRDIMTARPL